MSGLEVPGFIVAADHDGILSLLKHPDLPENHHFILEHLNEWLPWQSYALKVGVYKATYYIKSWYDHYSGGTESDEGFFDFEALWVLKPESPPEV